MKVLITGVAGFIGAHVARSLLDAGAEIVGIDCMNGYYPPALKRDRMAALCPPERISFIEASIAERDTADRLATEHPDITHIAHLAAQAGVRHSLADPYAYVTANVMSQVTIGELARRLPRLQRIVYSSSSSVYGDNRKTPYAESDRVESPQSVYAATKRSAELLATTYCSLYGHTWVGLRYFTVVGPWGRPDMAYFSFAKAIEDGTPIKLFDGGLPERDFTYVDDIVAGTVAALSADVAESHHQLFNLGNHRPEPVRNLVRALEAALGKKAIIEDAPLPPGDVQRTYADIHAAARTLGFQTTTSLDEAIQHFVDWYREHDAGRYVAPRGS